MPSYLENGKLKCYTAKIGAIYGSNYISITNAGLMSFAGTAGISGSMIFNGKLNYAGFLSAAASASGLLIGGGTSALPLTSSTANAKFIELRCQNTATSGDNRLGYFRFDMAGAGQSGECIRAFTDLTAAVDTARGSHISLQIDDTGYVTGLGAGIDAQLYVGDAAVASGGTYTALNVEIYSAGSSSDISGATESSFIRINNGGDGTGAGIVDDNAVLLDLNGFTSGAAKVWYDHQGSAPANIEEWIKIRTPSGIRWLAVYNAVV